MRRLSELFGGWEALEEVKVDDNEGLDVND